jgi:hypothetical protein
MSNGSIDIYVDIESLVDLRAGTVGTISEDAFVELSMSSYRTREVDSIWSFAGVEESVYTELYQKKPKEVLTRSTVTGIPLMLSSVIEKINEERINDVTVGEPTLTINTYPFSLSEEERDALIAAMSCYVGTHIKMTVLSMPSTSLTPGYIKGHWNILVMYDFLGWLRTHSEILPANPIPDTTFYVPKLREDHGKTLAEFIEEASVEERHKKAFENLDPFDGLRMLLVSVLDVNWLDVNHFSELQITESDFNRPTP